MVDLKKRIAVIDFGGQYTHLITSRIRRLGAYSEIFDPQDIDSNYLLKSCSGIIYSGGPASVYDANAPQCSPEFLELGLPVLGICYGHQLIIQQLGGTVSHSFSREYGPAKIILKKAVGIFESETQHDHSTLWMSHGDEVTQLPEDFEILASTSDCKYAAVANLKKNIYGIQFHPEVSHSEHGDLYLKNFIRICGLQGTWDLNAFMENEIRNIKERVQDKKVFLLCSGGVDSTVAFALLARALPSDHLKGLLIDTGMMRYEEAKEVLAALNKHGINLDVVDASDRYFTALKQIYKPEEKRNIIGSMFVDVQSDSLQSMQLNSNEWYLGQGTIYPDTIESGTTKHSNKIKTHHNRVQAIEELIKAGKVIEPLNHLYKDEVRDLGRLLGLPDELVDRHPFPGPGLAVRCLCNNSDDTPLNKDDGAVSNIENKQAEFLIADRFNSLTLRVLPIKSVGVQGDQRTYARPVVIFPQNATEVNWNDCLELSASIPNNFPIINRVLLCLASSAQANPDVLDLVIPAYLTKERINVLQQADKIVHDFQMEKNIYQEIWQFPVVLVPLKSGTTSNKETIILRPIVSTDAMTANCYPMKPEWRMQLASRLMSMDLFDFVLYDLTSKPPGTIEWE